MLLARDAAAWDAFAAAPPAELRVADVPWPDTGTLRRGLALGLPGLDMRALQARWHPDRFMQRYGARLAAEEREGVMARVTAVAAEVNALKR